jgi:tetratricopeptide (TPR) repeat protein
LIANLQVGSPAGQDRTISNTMEVNSRAAAMRMPIIGLMLVLAGCLGQARADQDDPRLEGLFEQLAATGSAEVARAIEAEIWTIWLEIEDTASARLLRQGSDAMAMRLFPVAIHSFNRLIDRSPSFAEGWNRRATLHYLMGNDEASVRDIEQTLALEPRHFGALSGLGLIMLRNDQPAAALRSFEAALEVHPHLPAAEAHVEPLRQLLEGEPT